jgi:hypothetical protein
MELYNKNMMVRIKEIDASMMRGAENVLPFPRKHLQ